MRNRMEELMRDLPQDADAAIITSDVNRRYFTGLSSSAGTLLVLRDTAYFIIDFRYIEIAQKTVRNAKVMLQENLMQQLGELLAQHSAKAVAIESGYLTVAELEQFRRAIPSVGFLADDRLNDVILKMRCCKDEQELAAIIKAQEITDRAFTEILNFIHPGKSEKEIAAYLEYTMRRFGAEGLAFDTIVASGENTAMPHAVPGDRVLREGDFLTMDYGAMYDGYCSDMTRTVAIGQPTDEMRVVYECVLQAQRLALEAAKPGTPCCAVDAAARDHIYGMGYEGCFGHSTGHSLGLEVHEEPRFSSAVKPEILCESGMVLSVEPGIYLAGKFGVRIEDIIYFGQNEAKDLTNSPKELIIL